MEMRRLKVILEIDSDLPRDKFNAKVMDIVEWQNQYHKGSTDFDIVFVSTELITIPAHEQIVLNIRPEWK